MPHQRREVSRVEGFSDAVAVFSILALLYRHAYRLRDQLSLTPEDALAARVQAYSNVGIALAA